MIYIIDTDPSNLAELESALGKLRAALGEIALNAWEIIDDGLDAAEVEGAIDMARVNIAQARRRVVALGLSA